MNIFDYIDNYGIYSFEEEPFNEVDSIIFSFLAYVDYGHIVEKEKVRLSDAGRIHFGLHNKEKRNVIAVRDGTKVLNYIKDTKRYSNCYLFNYVYEVNHKIQFSAISIEYQKNRIYVSFEGTNQMISGWRENFLLSFQFPTITHRKAIEYLNKNYSFGNKKIIVGGHSKGGNLALVSSMCCNFLVRRKIIKIYNIDGPGLLDNEFSSNRFNRILDKYIHIIPNDSYIGILLNSRNRIVIKSNVKGPLCHDIIYWEVKNNHLVNAKLSSFSKELESGIKDFLKKHNELELENAVNDLDMVCEKAGITSLNQIGDNYLKLIDLISASKTIDKKSKKILYDLIAVIFKSFGNSKYKDFLSFITKLNAN